jgi:hypothetical protein
MAIKSKRGAAKRYYAIIRQCYRDAAGGTQYGIDWPTLRVLWPERYAEIQAIKTMYPGLPD